MKVFLVLIRANKSDDVGVIRSSKYVELLFKHLGFLISDLSSGDGFDSEPLLLFALVLRARNSDNTELTVADHPSEFVHSFDVFSYHERVYYFLGAFLLFSKGCRHHVGLPNLFIVRGPRWTS